jgi:hypothetical protein
MNAHLSNVKLWQVAPTITYQLYFLRPGVGEAEPVASGAQNRADRWQVDRRIS